MDEHQKRVIMENMHWICENTIGEYQLSTWFYLDGSITKSEYDSMNNRRNRVDKNYSLFNHVIAKGNSFHVLLNNLRNSDNHVVANFLETKLKEKLSFKRKMQGATLEKFLIPYLTFLCSETKNGDAIVKELLGRGFITTDDSIIIGKEEAENVDLTHPDIFYRNAELYKYLRHTCNYEELVRILRETGNGKIADHLDSIAV